MICVERKIQRCKFCGRKMNIDGLSYLANPFCNECFPERLEASGAIDLRDNSKVVDMGNGYVRVDPIDASKKITAKQWRGEHE